MLGQLFDRDDGPVPDVVQANQWYRKAAEQGHTLAQFTLALRHDNGQGVARDFAAALAWYVAAARQGHARAQLNAGLMYLSGQGTPADPAAAWRWLSQAERAGVPGAARYVGQAAARLDASLLASLRTHPDLLPA
jgi:TPR repeat protein